MKSMLSCLSVLVLACVASAQVPIGTQQARCDLQVRVTDDQGNPVKAWGLFATPFGVVALKADPNGVLYVGDRNSQLSVYAYGVDRMAFALGADGYCDTKRVIELPPVQGCLTCGTGSIKLVETVDVVLAASVQSARATSGAGSSTGGTQPPVNPPMCQYEERFVRSYTALCHDSTTNFASVSYVNGVCASPLDWSNSTANKQSYTATWSSSLTNEAQMQIEKALSNKLKVTVSGSATREWSYEQTVTFQGKLGGAPLPGMCGYACMNTVQRVFVTEKWIRCCVRQNGYGCLEWGDWRRDPRYGPIETRVNTGYCTTEMRLYPCATPPPVIPSCAN